MKDKRQMRVIRVVRVTPELKDVLDATAAKCGLTVAEVLRCIATGIRSGRPCCFVADSEKLKSATKSGAVVVNIEAGITVPDMTSAYALRRAIYLRCMEAGIRKYWGAWAEPFLIVLRGTGRDQLDSTAIPLSALLPTITAGGGHLALVTPIWPGRWCWRRWRHEGGRQCLIAS